MYFNNNWTLNLRGSVPVRDNDIVWAAVVKSKGIDQMPSERVMSVTWTYISLIVDHTFVWGEGGGKVP